jgi:hypothetical protein
VAHASSQRVATCRRVVWLLCRTATSPEPLTSAALRRGLSCTVARPLDLVGVGEKGAEGQLPCVAAAASC